MSLVKQVFLGCKAAEMPIKPNLQQEQVKNEDVLNKDQAQRLFQKLITCHMHV